MLKLLYRLNEQSLSIKSDVLSKGIRLIIKGIANCLLPLLYRLSSCRDRYRLKNKNNIIVSLTSYPQRISKLWIVIESIFRQSLTPERIVLWLSRDQFPRELTDIPKSLQRQMKRGLEILFVDGDIRSHKKYYYCFDKYPSSIVFLIDDDIIYSPVIIEDSFISFKRSSFKFVVGNFGFFYEWDDDKQYIKQVRSKTNHTRCFLGSGGGTMFIPDTINNFLLPKDVIINLCPTADDIFLNGIIALSGLKVHLASNSPLISLSGQRESLLMENGSIGERDSRNAEQMKAFIQYCLSHYGRNPFRS